MVNFKIPIVGSKRGVGGLYPMDDESVIFFFLVIEILSPLKMTHINI